MRLVELSLSLSWQADFESEKMTNGFLCGMSKKSRRGSMAMSLVAPEVAANHSPSVIDKVVEVSFATLMDTMPPNKYMKAHCVGL